MQYNHPCRDNHVGTVYINTANRNGKVFMRKELEYELEKFGAFYSGEQFNYIAYGESNYGCDDEKEVIRIVKYDKEFNRLGSVSVSNVYTKEPFSGGGVRMSEYMGLLVLHTGRLRYDGHQSSLTVYVRTGAMVRPPASYMDNISVSHSFDQYVLFDGYYYPVFLDLGDADPRAVVVQLTDGRQVNLLDIKGDYGNNYTGVTLGGFARSGRNYLAVMNTIDQESAGGSKSGQDVIICTVPRDFSNSEEVRRTTLGKYIGTDTIVSKPHLIAKGDDTFTVLWQENPYYGGDFVVRRVDGDGKPVGEARRIADIRAFYREHFNASALPGESPEARTVNPTASTVYVNGEAKSFDAYLIEGNNYFKLRDLALVLSGTEKQFEIGYDGATGAITLSSGKEYTPVGGEMAAGDGKVKSATLNADIDIAIDGVPVEITAYLIGGSNFVKLRDVMRLFDVGVAYDETTRSIGIDTSLPYKE